MFAQVSLAGLVQVKGWARRDKSHWWRIQAKRLDFVLVDTATLAPRLVVELDDASHDRADRRERDAFLDEVLAGVGLPILHVRWQRRYDARALAQQIAAAMGIAAPAPPIGGAAQQPPRLASFASAREPMPVMATPFVAATPALAPVPPVATQVVDAPAVVMTIAPAPAVPSRRVCGQCQAELGAGAKFCPQCGAMFAGL